VYDGNKATSRGNDSQHCERDFFSMTLSLTRSPGPVSFISFMSAEVYIPARQSTYHIRTVSQCFLALAWYRPERATRM
jgi:hypothetical protein